MDDVIISQRERMIRTFYSQKNWLSRFDRIIFWDPCRWDYIPYSWVSIDLPGFTPSCCIIIDGLKKEGFNDSNYRVKTFRDFREMTDSTYGVWSARNFPSSPFPLSPHFFEFLTQVGVSRWERGKRKKKKSLGTFWHLGDLIALVGGPFSKIFIF